MSPLGHIVERCGESCWYYCIYLRPCAFNGSVTVISRECSSCVVAVIFPCWRSYCKIEQPCKTTQGHNLTKPPSFSILAKGEGLFASYIPLLITERHTNSHGTTIIQSQCNDPRIPGHGDRLCFTAAACYQRLFCQNPEFIQL